MWDFDKKKMCGVKPHIGIGTMKKMWNLICGKFTAGRNYNLTLNNTIEDFVRDMGTYKQIYCYEISKDVFDELQKNLAEYENVTLVNKGVGEKNGIMYISTSEDASANKIVEQGEEEVEIVTLDEDIKGKITFIKMDIEGAEQQSLKGARRHISEEKPKLAVCTYHNNHDIWEIPKMLREMNPEYKLYMRYNGNGIEYEFNVTEFVTFAV